MGFARGHPRDARYEKLKNARSGYAEVVRVRFDPKRLSYEDLLRVFFRLHDPTTLNQQGNDHGSQYRSAIFVRNVEQRKIALQIRDEVERSSKWQNPVVTTVEEAAAFTPAEDFHQDYLVKNPGGYTCHYLRN